MFTGIVTYQGRITAITEHNQITTIHILPDQLEKDMKIGESVLH